MYSFSKHQNKNKKTRTSKLTKLIKQSRKKFTNITIKSNTVTIRQTNLVLHISVFYFSTLQGVYLISKVLLKSSTCKAWRLILQLKNIVYGEREREIIWWFYFIIIRNLSWCFYKYNELLFLLLGEKKKFMSEAHIRKTNRKWFHGRFSSDTVSRYSLCNEKIN